MADRAKLRAMIEKAWAAPWVARTFEIDCPCPNGVHCGDLHTCEEVEAPEAYPASHEEPAGEGEGQCVVQIAVPGLESLARPTAEFIAAARNELPALLDELDRAEALAQERLERIGRLEALARETVTEINAIGQAWRDDWSEFDGRTLKAQLLAATGDLDAATSSPETKDKDR